MTLRLLAAAAVFALTGAAFAQNATDLSPASNTKFLADFAHKPGTVKLADGLMYHVIKAGHGLKVSSAMDNVSVYYKGWLITGKVFDQTRPGQPARFQPSGLIRGWTEALTKMREGDEWQLVIPSELAYGAKGAGGGVIPPNQALVFDLALVSVSPAAP